MATPKAKQLRAALSKAQQASDQAYRSFLKAEDRYTELAARERDRAERESAIREGGR